MSVRALRRGTMAGRGAVGPFDPLSIAWSMAYWASDPSWTPPADAGAVSSWRDASGNSRTATQATGANQPLYRAASANFNSKPCIEFDGVNDLLMTAVGSSLAQPNEIVCVSKILSHLVGPGTRQVFDGAVSTARHAFFSADSISFWQRFAGGTSLADEAGAPFVGTHFHDITFTTTSFHWINGVEWDQNTGIGTHALTGLSIGNRYDGTRPGNVQIAFIGVYNGALSAGQRSDLLAWSQSFYGTP